MDVFFKSPADTEPKDCRMNDAIRLLIVDDAGRLGNLSRQLAEEGFVVNIAATRGETEALFREADFDAALLAATMVSEELRFQAELPVFLVPESEPDCADALDRVRKSLDFVRSEKELREIMEHVDAGVFVIHKAGKSFVIGRRYSAMLEELLENHTPAEADFVAMVAKSTPPQVSKRVRTFLKLMFQPGKKESILQELNPLKEAKFRFATEGIDGSISKNKFLTFSFRRVIRNDSVEYLLATAKDVTDKILMMQKLQQAEKKSHSHTDLLYKILRVEPGLLTELLRDIEIELDRGRSLLLEYISRETLVELHRSLNSVRRGAGVMDLDFLADEAAEFESKIEDIIRDESLDDQGY